jgi:FkbM family methyltransferase
MRLRACRRNWGWGTGRVRWKTRVDKGRGLKHWMRNAPLYVNARRRVRTLRKAWRGTNAYLKTATGVIHVGANVGQERDDYAWYGLNVLWVEPIPQVFAQLQRNIRRYRRQLACRHLVSDQDGESYEFHVASNQGESSSILDMGLHSDIWPAIHYEETLSLTSVTLDTLVREEQLDWEKYDVLVLDTQGAELLVLQGAEASLPHLRFVLAETADIEVYRGGALVHEIGEFLRGRGFVEQRRTVGARHAGGGQTYDVLYARPQRGRE